MPCELARERLRTVFRGEMDTAGLEPGPHEVKIVATTADGEVTHTGQVKVPAPK